MPHSLKEKHVFFTSFPLVALDKLHAILVANDKVLDERKSQQIQVHLLIPFYAYCHMQLKCNYFGRN
jgi:hypothetical protein